MFRLTITLFAIFILLCETLSAQGSSRLQPIPNVYLDCSSCDVTYIRSNITFVNYVRDQDDASIYLLINDQRTAGGGREFNLIFSEIGVEEGRSDTLRYVSSSTDTSDERRFGLNRYIKIGLIPYVTSTVAIQSLDIFYEELTATDEPEVEVDDPWNNWVFDIDLRSNMSGQAREFDFGLFGGAEAERTTETWKIQTSVRGEIRRRNVELTNRTLNVNRDWGYYRGMIAYSVSDHLSIGAYTGARFSKVNNIALSTYIGPSVEFNFFPYSDFQQRRFLVQYQISPQYRRYFNTTVFLKDEEMIVEQEVSGRLRYDQRWGRIDIQVSGSHFFHDLAINQLEFNPSFDVRVIRGLSVSISGSYKVINDQLSLAFRGDPNDPISIIEGIQRPTSYDYSLSFGLSYTFGSIYNNVVNSRF